MLPSFIESPFC